MSALCRHLYPQWPAVDMVAYMRDSLDPLGVDLLMQMLRYDPHKRISVRPLPPSVSFSSPLSRSFSLSLFRLSLPFPLSCVAVHLSLAH